MKLENEWFRPAACYLVLDRKMRRKDVAKLFGVNREIPFQMLIVVIFNKHRQFLQ